MMSGTRRDRCDFVAGDLVHRLARTLPAEVHRIAPAVQDIMTIVREMACAGDEEHAIELALTEALANAVVHGCRRDPSLAVEVEVECDTARGMLIVVRDPGDGFDPATVPSPIVGERLYAKGGRGIFLINRLMDEVDFAKGGTEIRMRKRPATR